MFVWKGSLFKIKLYDKIALGLVSYSTEKHTDEHETESHAHIPSTTYIHIYAHEGVDLTRDLPHRDEGGSGIVLHPCKGGHRIVARNGSADLTTKGVENAAARGVFDDELDQGRGGLGKASGGFDEEDGKVLGVIHEVAEDGPVPGPLGRGPERTKGPERSRG